MAFSNLFRRYSTVNEMVSASYAYMDKNPTAETLLDELEKQCQNSLSLVSLQNKHDSQMLNNSAAGSFLSTYNPTSDVTTTRRQSAVDYSWLTPKNNNSIQSNNEVYHLSDIIKMELGELIRNVLPEDCTLLINQFRRHIRAQTKASLPENIIALFRKTLADYIDGKSKNGSTINHLHETNHLNNKPNNKTSSNLYSFVRNNRINPKHQLDDEQHCIAELTEISVTSSSNDATDNTKPRSNSHV